MMHNHGHNFSEAGFLNPWPTAPLESFIKAVYYLRYTNLNLSQFDLLDTSDT